MQGEDWIDVLLEEVADDVTVGHVGPMASEYVLSGIPFLRSQNVEPLRINLEDVKFITAGFHARLRKSSLSPGDVVIVRTGKPGSCAVVPDWLPVANCSDLVIVRCGPDLDAHFLAYYVNSLASHHVAAHLVGAVQQHFNVASARTLRLHLPPLSEQRAIARILGALDDKIELNRQMNQTLEAIARAIFKSWFVNFDPVRAKMNGEPYPLDAATMALFPNCLVHSELGEIPEGWEVATIETLAEVTSGKRPAERFETRTTDITFPLYGGGGPMAYVSKPLFDEPIVLTGRVGTLGEVFRSAGPCWPSDNTLVAIPRQPRVFEFLYLQLLRIDFGSLNRGSTQPLVTQGDLKRQSFVLPTSECMRAFHDVAHPLYALVDANNIESHTLAEVRDALLPTLISGELRVPQVEGRLEATT